MRRRPALLVASLAALSLIAAGCGGGGDNAATSGGNSGSSGASGDAATILGSIKAATQKEPVKIGISLGVDLKGKLSDPQLAAFLDGGPIALDLSGPVDPAKQSGDLAFTVKAGKINLKGNLRVIDGKQGFISLNDKWYEVPLDTTTSATSAADPQKILDAIGDPKALLKSPTVVGSEDIGGVATDHVAGDVDTAALVQAIARISQQTDTSGTPINPKQITDAVAQLEKYLNSAKVDLWVGKDDKQIHQLKLFADATLDEETKKSSGLDGLGLNLTVSSVPADAPSVEAPAGAAPSSQLQSDLGGIILSGLGAQP